MNKETQLSIEKLKNYSNKDGYSIEKSKDNKYVVRVMNNKKKYYIGSKYNVENDINKFLLKIEHFNMETDFIIFGLGAGEHIKKLLEQTGENNNIFIFEPDKDILKLFMETDMHMDIINNNRVYIYLMDDIDIDKKLKEYTIGNKINNIKVVIYANYNSIYENQSKELVHTVNSFLDDSYLNINTLEVNSKKFFSNYVNNLKHILNSISVNEFKTVFKGKTAVIVSAGPSLDKNLQDLIEIQENLIIICGGRTLKPLLNMGIKPDFLVVVDPFDVNATFLEGINDFKAPIVFQGISNHKAVSEYKGLKIYSKHKTLENYIEKILDTEIYSLYQAGSVAHACTDLAAYLGCENIIFIGQDLAYTNNNYHSNNAAISKNEVDNEVDNLIYVEDIQGNKVMTTPVLDYYRRELEKYIINNSNINFINSTEGGANIKGTSIMPLNIAANIYGKYKIDKEIKHLFYTADGYNVEEINRKIDVIIKDYYNIKKLCNNGLNYIEQASKYDKMKQQKKILDIIKKLYDINNKIINVENLDFANILISPILEKTIFNEKYILEEKESIYIIIEKVINSSKELYFNIIECMEYIIDEIEQNIRL